MVKCPKCGKENKDGAQFCEKCGSPIEKPKGFVAKFKNLSTTKKVLLILLIIVVIFILLAMFSGSGTSEKTTINVTNVAVSPEGYGLYKLTCDLVPDKNYNYLEAQIIFYDSNGAIIEKSPLVWNINKVTQGQMIKVDGSAYISGGTPAKAQILFFDKTFASDNSDAIYTLNVTM